MFWNVLGVPASQMSKNDNKKHESNVWQLIKSSMWPVNELTTKREAKPSLDSCIPSQIGVLKLCSKPSLAIQNDGFWEICFPDFHTHGSLAKNHGSKAREWRGKSKSVRCTCEGLSINFSSCQQLLKKTRWSASKLLYNQQVGKAFKRVRVKALKKIKTIELAMIGCMLRVRRMGVFFDFTDSPPSAVTANPKRNANLLSI